MFLLFVGHDYDYPDGGARDLQGRFETLDEAVASVECQYPALPGTKAWANILRLADLKIVKSFFNGAWRGRE